MRASCKGLKTLCVIPIPVPITPLGSDGVPGMPGVVIVIVIKVPKHIESSLKTNTIGYCQLLHKGSIPKIAVCNLVLAKE